MSSQQELMLGPAREFEHDRVFDLWDEQFGTFGHEEDLLEDAFDPDTNGIWCITLGTRKKLYGFAVVTRFTIEQFTGNYPDVDTSDWPKATYNGNTHMVCVADRAKNNGYAKYLVQRGHAWQLDNDVRRVFATCWHRDDHVDSRRLFRSLGYEKIGEQAEHYRTEEGEPDRDCPDCGVGCTCNASFWTKAITQDDTDDL